jgi:hypothetical protein
MGPVFTFSNASSCRANYDEVMLFLSRRSVIFDVVIPPGLWNGDDGWYMGGLRGAIQDIQT